MTTITSPLKTVEQAAELLAVPTSWLRKAATDPGFPCTRVGRYVRFTDEDIAAIVERGRRQPVKLRRVA